MCSRETSFGSTIRSSTVGFALISAAIVALSLGCPADTGIGDSGDNDTPSTDPRDPADLPGSATDPGEDPCADDRDCYWQARGVGTQAPFSGEDAMGALVDDDGALTLDAQPTEQFFAWIPNTDEGSISRIDTATRTEVGRYRTGPSDRKLDPSRTSVSDDGGVYVANGSDKSMTRIDLHPNCQDLSGTGELTTSSGPDELLDWGSDDCMGWHQSLSGYGPVTAIAAQQSEAGPVVWVGARDRSIWKLDGQSGQPIFRTESPVQPHGFAVDYAGNLWIASAEDQQLGRLDTTQCTDHGSCETTICDGDDLSCVKNRISAPGPVDGIALDDEQRVWLGGHLSRYDRMAASGARWVSIAPGIAIEGIATDGQHWVYGAAGTSGLHRFAIDDLHRSTLVSETSNRSVSAVDVDAQGFVWAINRDHNDAFVIDAGNALYDGQIVDQVAGFDRPDAYSDMTGYQVQFPTEQRGVVGHVFSECDRPNVPVTEWQTLRFDADTPEGSSIHWRVRGADYRDNLDEANWLVIGTAPTIQSPLDLRAVLAQDGSHRSRYIEIEAELVPEFDGDQLHVPRLFVFDIVATCPEVVR